jgi:glutamine amidotransferase
MAKRLAVDAVITNRHEVIAAADKLILPGVGNFQKGMENLRENGLKDLLDEMVLIKKKPVLGICLGAQLMTRHSEEGNVPGLGWVDAVTVKFDQTRLGSLKIPHMGWCEIVIKNNNPLWYDLPPEPRFYHVHSYHFSFKEPLTISATSVYGYSFVSAFHKENIFGTQFHPEKSHKYGMKVLENFAKL